MYFEDVDLGYSFGKAGWVNRYEPRATVTHIGATSTSQESGRMLREHHRSAQRFLARKYGGWYLLPVRLALRAGLGVRAWWLTRAWD
jgi:N-acetylglucosaminyl-diphospho-decaprenol L-rhamnosyltransferase